MPAIEPHSPRWFAIVDRADRRFGRAVRATIACEGSRDVCTLCGYPPVADYQMVEAVHIRRAIPSLRLCDGCLVDRQVAGETLVLLSRGSRSNPSPYDATGFLGFWKRLYRRIRDHDTNP